MKTKKVYVPVVVKKKKKKSKATLIILNSGQIVGDFMFII